MIGEKGSLNKIKLKELETPLLELHYQESIIKAGVNKALKIPQKELRNLKKQEKKDRITFYFNLSSKQPQSRAYY